MTCGAMRNAISSPGSADGATPQGSPDGPTTGRSGRVRAPASRSASRAKAQVSTTRGICGPTSFASSVPAGPLSSWESRLRARLATVGSTECSLIWREKTTPAGASISRLAPWTPPTSDSDSTGSPATWPTPEAGAFGSTDMEQLLERRAEYQKKYGNNGFGLTLGQSMSLAHWPTPAAADLAGGRSNPEGTSPTGQRPDGKKAQVGLPAVMKEASPRATPTARDWKSGHASEATLNRNARPLNEQMQATWSTPRASDGEKGGPNMTFGAGGQPLPAQIYATAPSGPTTNGSSATTEKRGAPNPAHPCWLMGYPAAWLSGADSATPSSRNSRRK